MADPGVCPQIVTQLAVGQEALLAREVDALLAGLALHREVRAPGTWGGDTPDLGASHVGTGYRRFWGVRQPGRECLWLGISRAASGFSARARC